MAQDYIQNKEALRADLEMKLQKFLKSGIPTKEIAAIFGAEEFLRTIKSHSEKHGDVVVFDVKNFVSVELEKKNAIKLPSEMELSDEVILPPGSGQIQVGGEGRGLEKPGIIPRTRLLIDLLSSLNLEYSVVQGSVTEEMMRGQSYVVFKVPARRKVVFVNNEEGNATYILHDTDPDSDEWKEFASIPKEDLKGQHYAARVSFHKWVGEPMEWQNKINDALDLDYQPKPRRQRGAQNSSSNEGSDNENLEYAPEGWLHLFGIEKKIGKARAWISPRIPALLAAHPDWAGKDYLTKGKLVSLHYPPELIAELKRMSEEYKSAPEGWLTEGGIAKVLGKEAPWVKSRVRALLKEFPEWNGKEYLVESGFPRLHYPPELIAELKRMSEEYKSVPENWKSDLGIAKFVKKDVEWVIARIKILLAEHPDWAGKKYLNERGLASWHYPPELIEELRKMSQEHLPAPEGWMSIKEVANLVGKADNWVVARLPALLEKRPEWASDKYLDKRGRSGSISCSPELIVELKKMSEEYEPAPENWKTTGGAAALLGKTFKWVSARIPALLENHPEWANDQYLDKGGHAGLTHYAPELIEELRKMSKEYEPAPEDWLTERMTADAVEKDVTWVRARIPALLEQHPEWANDRYINKVGQVGVIHYAPALIEELRKMSKEYEPAPEDWLTVGRVATLLGKTAKWVSDRVPALLVKHPDWEGKLYLNKEGLTLVHYPPELFDEFKRMSKEYEFAPENWLTRNAVASLVGKTAKWVGGRLPALLEEHPDWVSDKYLDKVGRPGNLHYSSELIAALEKIRDSEKKT